MSSEDEHRGIYVGSLDSSETRFLLNAAVFARYTAPGYLLFLREAMLMAQAFDATSFELTGEPHRIADGLAYNPGNGRTTFSVSDAGVLAYRGGGVGGNPPVSSPTPMSIAYTHPYDVTADGERFLVNALAEETAAVPITVVVNWTAALEP